MISTTKPKNKKISGEVFTWFKNPQCSISNKIAILQSLVWFSPFFAAEAAGWIKKQDQFKHETRLLCIAEEILNSCAYSQEKLKGLQSKYHDVVYDEEIFIQTVEGLEYFEARDWVKEFDSLELIDNILDRFHSLHGRFEFFKMYVLNFRTLTMGR